MARNKHGYILAELMTAVFIIGVLMAVTVSLIFMCSDETRASHRFFIARQIASSQLEILKKRPFDQLAPTGDDGETFTGSQSAELPDFAGTVHIEPFNADPDIRRITVTVRWHEKRRTRELSFSVLRTRRTP